jgi:hypothetical protein
MNKYSFLSRWITAILLAGCLAGCANRLTTIFPDGESQYQAFASDGIPFVIADSAWNVDGLGNHRAVVSVKEAAHRAVVVTLPWRRPDIHPEIKGVKIVDATTGKAVKDIHLLEFSAEKGVFAFRPETAPGTYYMYYLPYSFEGGYGSGRWQQHLNIYLPPDYKPDAEWQKTVMNDLNAIPAARTERFEARSRFDFFTPMGLIATAEEIRSMEEKYPGDFILFPEDRAFPVRLNTVPVRWYAGGASKTFEGFALRNEYYTWQIGVWTPRGELKNVRLSFSDFHSGKDTIAAKEITCFHQEGTGWDGKPLRFTVNIPERSVQPLWCGVQIPETASGSYKGQVTVSAEGVSPQQVDVTIHVGKDFLADRGDGELWRHARLRWLNSTIGMDNLPVKPYSRLQADGDKITASDKTLVIGRNGLPASILVNDCEVFAQPVEFAVTTSDGTVSFAADGVQMEKVSDGLVRWKASAGQNGLKFDCNAWMEYDGYIRYRLQLSADRETALKDVRLTMSYTPAASTYFMGAGHEGGARPFAYGWDWKGWWDSYWTGGVHAGIHQEFRGSSYHGPLLREYGKAAPETWSNAGQGRITVAGAPNRQATVTASTGHLTVSPIPLDFEFSLLITPVKPLRTATHFSDRYYHSSPEEIEQAAKDGATVVNIHHAKNLNPVINYPFIVREPLIKFIRSQHAAKRKVKLYYTIRELSNYAAEIYALKSLNHEIFTAGKDYLGLPWQAEHLVDGYRGAWWTELPGQNLDASLSMTPFSRWINYYLEGLRWMLENYEIDGLYMDDVAFDREIMKRIRRIMAQYRPDAVIDLHSHKQYSNGPANSYTDFFPYVDRLWFGEGFDYNKMTPDEWLVTFSGIPFGVMSEMLQSKNWHETNRYLGMVYGTTARYLPVTDKHSPVPVWKLWQSFGIEKAQMIGYWEDKCPVKTDHPNVKATVYVQTDKTLIAIGNFDEKDHHIRLSFDGEHLGVIPAKATLYAPEIENFQKEQTFKPNEAIPVKSKEGWLLIIEK